MGYCAACDHEGNICAFHHLVWLLQRLNGMDIHEFGTVHHRQGLSWYYEIDMHDGTVIDASSWSTKECREYTDKVFKSIVFDYPEK